MNRLALMASIALVLVPSACLAQSRSPYAGFETRAIKALSDQQISELRTGLGMSLALAAELNGYPGPRHTIEFAADLRALRRAARQGGRAVCDDDGGVYFDRRETDCSRSRT